MPGVTVFGGAGFIGSHLIDELLTQGQEVLCVDNLSEGKLEHLKRWRNHKKFDFVQADIKDFDVCRRAVDHREWVFHLAAMSRIVPSIEDPVGCFMNNCQGTVNVLEACRQGGVKRVVYSASSSAYGNKNGSPQKETMAPDCLNPYALSKEFGEELCDLYRKLYGLSTVSLRYFNVYGPRHQENGSYATVIAIFRRLKREGKKLTIVGDGEQRRDFTFVGDVVRANIMAAMNRDVVGVVNIGSGVNFSMNQIADMVGGEREYIPPRPGEARETLADISRARLELGWSPNISLAQGLEILDIYEKRNTSLLISL